MTEQLNEAIQIIRELPEDEQDTIARQLMRLIDIDQHGCGVRLRRRAFVNGAARASPPSGFNP